MFCPGSSIITTRKGTSQASPPCVRTVILICLVKKVPTKQVALVRLCVLFWGARELVHRSTAVGIGSMAVTLHEEWKRMSHNSQKKRPFIPTILVVFGYK